MNITRRAFMKLVNKTIVSAHRIDYDNATYISVGVTGYDGEWKLRTGAKFADSMTPPEVATRLRELAATVDRMQWTMAEILNFNDGKRKGDGPRSEGEE